MKLISWNCRGLGNPTTVSELRQLLTVNYPNMLFLCETKSRTSKFDRIQRQCNMVGYFVVDAVERKRGLAVMWNDDSVVNIQSFLANHVDMIVIVKNSNKVRFTGFYGHPEPSQEYRSWELLREIGSKVNEYWVVGGLQRGVGRC